MPERGVCPRPGSRTHRHGAHPAASEEPLSLRGWHVAKVHEQLRALRIVRAYFAAERRAADVRTVDEMIGKAQRALDAYAAELGPEERVPELHDATLDWCQAVLAPQLGAPQRPGEDSPPTEEDDA